MGASPSRVVVLAALCVLAACSPSSTADSSAPSSPEAVGTVGKRLASLAPTLTESLIALGAADALVAVSDYCPPLPGGRTLPKVGTALTPSYEGLARAEPDLILTQKSATARLEGLEAIAPTVALSWQTVEDAVGSLRELGRAIGAEAEGKALATRFETTLRTPEALPKDAPTLLAVFAVGGDARPKSLWYVRSDSLHGAALGAAGLRNALPEPPGGPPEIAIETLVRLDPDGLLILGQDPDAVDRTDAFLRELTVLQAVKEGRIAKLAGPEVLQTGPALLRLVPMLRAAAGADGDP